MADDAIVENDEEQGSDDESQDSSSRESRGSSQGRRSPSFQGRGDRRSSRGGGQTRYSRSSNFRSRRKVCAFCADKMKTIDWKNIDLLRRFIGDDGSIRARRKTGTCARHQRRLAVAVKRARQIALLPFTGEHNRLSGRS